MTITLSKNCCDCNDEIPPCDECEPNEADCEVYLNVPIITEDSSDYITYEGKADSIGTGSFLVAIFQGFDASQTTKFTRFELWTDQSDLSLIHI